MHAVVQIGDSFLMLGEAKGDCQPTNTGLYLYVKDSDDTYQRALKAGAKTEMELGDQFFAQGVNCLQVVDAESVGRTHRGDNRDNPSALRQCLPRGFGESRDVDRVIQI